MLLNNRILLFFLKSTALFIFIFTMTYCVEPQNNKFGKEYNKERKKIGLPIIKDSWTFKQGAMYDGAFFYSGPKDNAIWYTNRRTKDKTLPYYAYKTICFNGDTLVAEIDTYLNPSQQSSKPDTSSLEHTDTFEAPLETYKALNIIYVYEQLHLPVKDFSRYSLGFNYEISGQQGGYAVQKKLDRKQAEGVLKSWNLKRLNY